MRRAVAAQQTGDSGDGVASTGAAYGERFFDELRRLTNSTSGLAYADVSRVRATSRDQVLGVLARQYDLDWMLHLDSRSPEGFARALVREGPARARDATLAVEALFGLLDVLS